MNLTGNDLKQIGFIEGKALGIALDLVESRYQELSFDDKLELLRQVLNNPSSFINDAVLAPVAIALLKPADEAIALHAEGKPYQTYGAEAIELGARQQMETAMKLPVTVAGALMPDAHQGYGLPIGGVLATDNAVIPYGVGVDIGCRMCMTLYDMNYQKRTGRSSRIIHAEDCKDVWRRKVSGGGLEFSLPGDGSFELKAGQHSACSVIG